MGDKDATVRVKVDDRGFFASIRKMGKAGDATGAQVGGAISKRVKAAAKESESALAGLAKVRPERGLIAGMRDFEARAIASAKRVGSALRSSLGGAARGLGGMVAGAAKGAAQRGLDAAKGGALALGAGAVAGAGKLTFDAAGVSDKANRLSISARGAGQEAVDPKLLEAEFYAVAQDIRGLTADSVADAAAAFVSLTGDLTTARGSMRDFGEVAMATGADIKDVAETAASITTQFGVTDPKQIREILAALTQQGKAGSFELKDAAAQFQRLAASGAAFGLSKDVEGVKTLGGLTQIARAGTGSGEQAATAVENLFSALQSKGKELRAAGVSVYRKDGTARDVREIIAEAIGSVGGSDMAKKQQGLVSIFGAEGKRAINPLVNLYADTFRNTEGSQADKRTAAWEAVRKKLYDASNAAGDWTEIVKDSGQAQNSASAKLTNAYQKLQAAAADKLLPAFVSMVDKLTEAPEAIDGLILALEVLGEGLEMFGFYAKAISEGKSVEETARTIEAEKARRRAGKAQKEVDSLEGQLAKTPAGQRGELEGKLLIAKATRDAATETAVRNEQAVMVSQATRSGFAIQAEQTGAAAIEQTLSQLARAQQNMQIKGEVKVRVTNPDDIKSAAPGSAPSPGFMPR